MFDGASKKSLMFTHYSASLDHVKVCKSSIAVLLTEKSVCIHMDNL